jgi:hypothetical protein
MALTFCSCIQGLAKFVQPILDLISTHTGFQVTMLARGPEPADGGHLNVIRYVSTADFVDRADLSFLVFMPGLQRATLK